MIFQEEMFLYIPSYAARREWRVLKTACSWIDKNQFRPFPRKLKATSNQKGHLRHANLSPAKIRTGSRWPYYLGFKASLVFCCAILLVWVSDQGQMGAGDGWCWWINDCPHPTSTTVKPSKHSHQRTGEQNAIVTSTRIQGAISSMSMLRTTSLYPQTVPPNTKKQRNKQRRARQWNEMTPSSAVGIMRMKSISLILEHFQEQWGKEFGGAFHLHVQEAAGMAGSNHPQVCHLHQEFWPKVCHMMFPIIDIVFKGQ